MSHYDDKPDDLILDTKNFMKSEYGKYIVSTLEETARGYLSKAGNVDIPYPERYAAKFSALREALQLIYTPLDDDTPSQGN